MTKGVIIFPLHPLLTSVIFIPKMRYLGPIYTIYLILTLCTSIAAEPAGNDFTLAKKSFQDGFYEIAANSLEKFISENPQTPDILEAKLLLGESLVHVQRFMTR